MRRKRLLSINCTRQYCQNPMYLLLCFTPKYTEKFSTFNPTAPLREFAFPLSRAGGYPGGFRGASVRRPPSEGPVTAEGILTFCEAQALATPKPIELSFQMMHVASSLFLPNLCLPLIPWRNRTFGKLGSMVHLVSLFFVSIPRFHKGLHRLPRELADPSVHEK